MTGPRIPHTRATVRLETGEDRPTGACFGLAEKMRPNPTPYDLMIEHKQGTTQHRLARAEAAAICGRCVLDCDFRVTPLAACGTEAAYRRHFANGEKPCEPCKLAHTERKRRRYAEQKGAAA